MYHSVAPRNELRHFGDQDSFGSRPLDALVTKILPMVILWERRHVLTDLSKHTHFGDPLNQLVMYNMLFN